MSEFVSSWHFSEHDQKAKIKETGQAALEIVDDTYGDGYPDYRQRGHRELAYHNGHHGRSVGNTAFKLCTLSGLSELESETGRSAGYAHDLTQLKGRGIDENESAEWLERELAQGDIVEPRLRKVGALAIVGTQPVFEDGKLTGQLATTLDYPSKEAEVLGLGLASADLGEIYTPEGPLLAHQLLREINSMADPRNLSTEKIAAFQRNQVGLLETYTFPLPVAQKELTKHKSQVIAYSADLLRRIEAGEITTWDELIERDQAFAAALH